MIVSSLVAMLVGIGAHGFSVYNSILAAISGFNVGMIDSLAAILAAISGFNVGMIDSLAATGNAPGEMASSLLNRGGVNSMSSTLIIIIAAFLIAAGMDVSGALDKLLQSMLERARTVFGLVAATLASGAIMIALTSHGGVTALIVGGLFQDGYRERGLAPENLSRSLEDSVNGNHTWRADPAIPAVGHFLHDRLDFFFAARRLFPTNRVRPEVT